jgi:alpha-N-arabinofuranosidase
MNHIKIDLERILSDIDRNVFGGYMELGYQDTRFAYMDLGDSPHADKNNLRADVRTALEKMNFSNMRFPGGNFASGYRWQDGVGPRQERPSRHDLAWRCLVQNQYGTNEFIRLCRALNIEPYLCVNCGDGDMREAADWVEYCNGATDSALANLRRRHGFEQPHKVKYWGIGNEVDSAGQIGYKTPQEYARAITEYSKVMKRTDPDIKLIASAVCSWEDFPLSPGDLNKKTEWVERTRLMLEQTGERIDYLALHRYSHPSPEDPYETLMAFAEDFNERLSAYEGLLRAVSLEHGIRHNISLAVDEWGMMRVPSGLRRDTPVTLARDEWGIMRLPAESKDVRHHEHKMIITLEDAVVTGLYLNAFIRHAGSVRMANFTPMPTFMGMINPERPDDPVLLPAIFYPFEVYNRTCGQLALDVFWYGDTFSGTYKNRSYSGIRTLDVAATLDKARKQLVVYVVNQSKTDALEAAISLADGQFAGNVQVSIINGQDIKAENTMEKPHQISVRESTIKAAGKSLTVSFEPHSVTTLVCKVG